MAEELVTITFQLSPELDEFVQSLARAATISKSAVLRQILTQAKADAEAMARLGEAAKATP